MNPSPTPATEHALGSAPRAGRYAASTTGQDRLLSALFVIAEHSPRLLHRLARLLGRAAWALSPGVRSAVRANLSHVLGDGSATHVDRIGRSLIANFIRFVADLGEAQHLSPNTLVSRASQIEGKEHFQQSLALGRGLIVATAHLGSFEVGLAVTAEKSPAAHVVFSTDPFPRFDRLRRRLREKLGVHESRSEDGWSMWAGLRDALERGEVVVMQADRVMPGQKGEPVTFCGAPMPMPTGAVRLAQLTGAPIVPVFAVRSGDRHMKLIIEEPVMVDAEGDARHAQQQALQRLADVIARQVRAYPDQWLMLHRVWPSEFEGGERLSAT